MDLARDLHLNDITMKDIKRALGFIDQRTVSGDLLGRVSLFGAGLLVGAGLALLLSPLRGEEVREKIHDTVDGLRGQKANGEDRSATSPS